MIVSDSGILLREPCRTPLDDSELAIMYARRHNLLPRSGRHCALASTAAAYAVA